MLGCSQNVLNRTPRKSAKTKQSAEQQQLSPASRCRAARAVRIAKRRAVRSSRSTTSAYRQAAAAAARECAMARQLAAAAAAALLLLEPTALLQHNQGAEVHKQSDLPDAELCEQAAESLIALHEAR